MEASLENGFGWGHTVDMTDSSWGCPQVTNMTNILGQALGIICHRYYLHVTHSAFWVSGELSWETGSSRIQIISIAQYGMSNHRILLPRSTSRKLGFPDMTEILHKWTHSFNDCMHDICNKIKPVKVQHEWRTGSRSSTHSWGAIGKLTSVGKSQFLLIYPLTGCPCSRRWS